MGLGPNCVIPTFCVHSCVGISYLQPVMAACACKTMEKTAKADSSIHALVGRLREDVAAVAAVVLGFVVVAFIVVTVFIV